jgi:hypothetical protein
MVQSSARRARRLRTRGFAPLLSWTCGLVLLGSIAGLRAETTVTVLDTEAAAPVTAAERAFFDGELAATLRSQQLTVTAKSDRDLIFAEEKRLQTCTTAVCIERIGRLLGSRFVVRAEAAVSRSGATPTEDEPKKDRAGKIVAPKTTPGSWTLKLALFHVDIGASGAQVQTDCPRCDTALAGQALSELLQKALFEEAARPRGSLGIASKPPGALVFVDGTDLGVTPFKRPTYSGKHRLVLRSAGFRSVERDIEVPESQRLQLDITLVEGADPAEIPTEAKTPVYKKWWFWVAVGGAAAAIAGATTAGVLASSAPTVNGSPATNHFVF